MHFNELWFMRKFKIKIGKLFVSPCHALHSIYFADTILFLLQKLYFFNSGCPFQLALCVPGLFSGALSECGLSCYLAFLELLKLCM